jgi:cytochrome c biogenesis protein CcdA
MENTETSSFDSFDNHEMPANNMALAIIATVLGLCSPCCIGLILGIIAIVMASQVKKKHESRDHEGAQKSAKTAKILALIAIGLTVLNLIYVGLNFEDSMTQFETIMEQYGQ